LGGHFSDLVQKQRASVGHFEPAGLLPHRSAKGSLFVAEQFAFHQGFGQRGDIGGDERADLPDAQVVNRSGHEFLSRAALALDQDGHVGVGHLTDAIEHMLHGGAAAHHVGNLAHRAEPLPQSPVLFDQAVVLQGVANLQPQHVQVHRLGDKVVCPLTHRLDRRLDRAVGGDHQDHGLGPRLLDLAEQVDAGQPSRHLQVRDDHLMAVLPEHCQGLFGVRRRAQLVGFAREPFGQAAANVRFVIDDQDAETVLRHASSRGGSKGTVMRNVVPCAVLS